MSWTTSKTNGSDCPTCWVNPKWAAYLRDPKNIPFVDVDMTKGTEGLNGYRKPTLGPCKTPENEAGKKYQRDFLAGKVVIPGLKVSVKLTDGSEYGACKPFSAGNAKPKAIRAKIKPAPRVKLDF
jgi:hypothetical protein